MDGDNCYCNCNDTPPLAFGHPLPVHPSKALRQAQGSLRTGVEGNCNCLGHPCPHVIFRPCRSLTLSVARLTRASVLQKKWQTEFRDKLKFAAREVDKIAKNGGLTDESVAEIREKILVVVD